MFLNPNWLHVYKFTIFKSIMVACSSNHHDYVFLSPPWLPVSKSTLVACFKSTLWLPFLVYFIHHGCMFLKLSWLFRIQDSISHSSPFVEPPAVRVWASILLASWNLEFFYIRENLSWSKLVNCKSPHFSVYLNADNYSSIVRNIYTKPLDKSSVEVGC